MRRVGRSWQARSILKWLRPTPTDSFCGCFDGDATGGHSPRLVHNANSRRAEKGDILLCWLLRTAATGAGGNFSPLGHRTNGVEPTVTRYFNPYSIGPSFVHLTCPNCQTRFEDIDRAMLDQIGHGFSSWMERGEVTDVVCPRCSKAVAINGWECRPPIGMGNLALIFWNWPRLDSPGWRIDLRKVVSEVTGHPTVYTWGKI
jgi:hypothetical protein